MKLISMKEQIKYFDKPNILDLMYIDVLYRIKKGLQWPMERRIFHIIGRVMKGLNK